MPKADRIISLTEKISAELQHFVPCVPSEIEAKAMIHVHLQHIQGLAQDIQRYMLHTSSEKFAIAGACHDMSYQVKSGRPVKTLGTRSAEIKRSNFSHQAKKAKNRSALFLHSIMSQDTSPQFHLCIGP